MSQEPVQVSTHFEIELLVPRANRQGSRWRKLTERPNLVEARETMEDFFLALLSGGLSEIQAYDWTRTHLRAVEVTVTAERGQAHFYQA